MNEKQRMEEELFELNKVRFVRPTAQQLHQKRYALVSRVQRKEDKRYWQEVQKKKTELEKNLLDLKAQEQLMGASMGAPLAVRKSLVSPKRTLTRMKSKPRMEMGRYGD